MCVRSIESLEKEKYALYMKIRLLNDEILNSDGSTLDELALMKDQKKYMDSYYKMLNRRVKLARTITEWK